jgi:hypothetical protein
LITRETLARFAGSETAPKQKPSTSGFDAEGYLAKHGLRSLRRKSWTSHPGGWIFELVQCPFDDSHVGGSAALTVADGKPGFRCQHNGCADKTIKDVFSLYPPIPDSGVPAGEVSVDSESRSDSGAPAKTQSQLLIDGAASAELFHTSEGESFASFPVQNHREIWPLSSRGFRRWLIHQFYLKFRKPPSPQALQDATGVLEARAQFDSPEAAVFIRIAPFGDGICIDLCNADWEAVVITPAGWEVVAQAPVRFRRSKGMLPLPRPSIGGSVSSLRQVINIGDDKNWILLLSWLLAACRPRGPYPVLIFQGEQGSAKSTTARIVRGIIDPSTALLRTPPREERDLIIAANNSRVVAYDNLSGLPQWFSDALCRLATGGGFSARELYTDADEVIIDVQRPVILNSIDHLPERPDLAERSIILTLPQIEEITRRDEAQLHAQYEGKRAEILGGLCSALVCALRRFPAVHLQRKPRMADFALWATAGEEGFGFPHGAFMAAYSGNRAEAVQETLDCDAVAPALTAFMTDDADGETWTGTAGELLAQLDLRVAEGIKKSGKWPKSARGLSGDLRRLAPFLRQVGIGIDFNNRRGKAGQRLLSIKRIEMHSTVSTVSTVLDRPTPKENEPLSQGRIGDGRDSPGTVQPSRNTRPSLAHQDSPLAGKEFDESLTIGTVETVVCSQNTDRPLAERESPGRIPVDSCSEPERPMSRREAK